MSEQQQTRPTTTVAEETEEREINLVELGYELLDKWKYIVIAALLGAILAGIYSFIIAVPQYEAIAKLYVLNSDDSVVNLSDLQLGNYLASDYTEVFRTWEVNEIVKTNLNLSYTYEQLDDMVKVSNPQDTRILYITVTSPSPQEAMDMANEYAKVVSEYVQQIMATEKPNMLSAAILPTIPVSPHKTANILIGFLIGALLTVGIFTVRFVMDDTIKSADDVQKYANLPVLAIIPTLHDGEHSNTKNNRS